MEKKVESPINGSVGHLIVYVIPLCSDSRLSTPSNGTSNCLYVHNFSSERLILIHNTEFQFFLDLLMVLTARFLNKIDLVLMHNEVLIQVLALLIFSSLCQLPTLFEFFTTGMNLRCL